LTVNLASQTHPVITELVLLSGHPDGLRWRTQRAVLPVGSAPDEHARVLVGWDGAAPAGSLIHSTSWRYDPLSESLILTWAVAPDPDPASATRLVDGTVAQGSAATEPVPVGLTMESVVAHAARHLAFLSHTDEVVAAAVHHHPHLHDALLGHNSDVAGRHTITATSVKGA
jgi:hypothetical protein